MTSSKTDEDLELLGGRVTMEVEVEVGWS